MSKDFRWTVNPEIASRVSGLGGRSLDELTKEERVGIYAGLYRKMSKGKLEEEARSHELMGPLVANDLKLTQKSREQLEAIKIVLGEK